MWDGNTSEGACESIDILVLVSDHLLFVVGQLLFFVRNLRLLFGVLGGGLIWKLLRYLLLLSCQCSWTRGDVVPYQQSLVATSSQFLDLLESQLDRPTTLSRGSVDAFFCVAEINQRYLLQWKTS
jgi:hypothetical protein